jgi:hypothetical protein
MVYPGRCATKCLDTYITTRVIPHRSCEKKKTNQRTNDRKKAPTHPPTHTHTTRSKTQPQQRRPFLFGFLFLHESAIEKNVFENENVLDCSIYLKKNKNKKKNVSISLWIHICRVYGKVCPCAEQVS